MDEVSLGCDIVKAAVLYETGKPLSIEEVRFDPPKANEVRVKVAAAGVCRSDLHVINGEAQVRLPVVPGHEGAGIVQEVGPGVTLVAPGDHVILVFVSSCGRCYQCTVGRPNICETHASTPVTMLDGTHRLHTLSGEPITHLTKLSCFAEEAVVPEAACVRIEPDFPLDQAALIGCCVTTGVGASTSAVHIEPGSTVAVVACGGVGLNVVQARDSPTRLASSRSM